MPDGVGVSHLVDVKTRPTMLETKLYENNIKIQYWLFTRNYGQNPQIIKHGNIDSLRQSNYKSNRPLKVIVHGWMNSLASDINLKLTSAFLKKSDCNVIVVDWSSVAGRYNYFSACVGVLDVGREVGSFVDWVISMAGGNWNNVHFVGHSLGAHAVGNAGRSIGGRVARITGLDPAGPAWVNNKYALSANDGQYVECIHTDGHRLGIMYPICAANFYPNGGRNPQPGCWISTCSHKRAYLLMEATILHDHLVGRECHDMEADLKNCHGSHLNMGNAHQNKQGSGLYGLVTGNKFPF